MRGTVLGDFTVPYARLTGLAIKVFSITVFCITVFCITSAAIAQADAPDHGATAAAVAAPAALEAIFTEQPKLADAPGLGFDMPQGGPVSESAASTARAMATPAWTMSSAPTYELASPSKLTLEQCPYDETRARECRVHWGQLSIESATFLTFLNAGNLYTGYWYRFETTHGAPINPYSTVRNSDDWWQRYVNSVEGWRWDKWSDDNPFLDDYVGHPMMGSITSFLWIQNDPRGMTLAFSNTQPYWKSRLRALAFSTAYSLQWKFGPAGEASIGHNGDHYFGDKGALTNETGWVELVTTPVGGLTWTVAEDVLDRIVIRRLEAKSRNPLLLLSYQLLNPARATANIVRFRPPWFRDSRNVRTTSHWSDPDPQETFLRLPEAGTSTSIHIHNDTEAEDGIPGGVNEFGAWWGLSLMSGHLWGYAGDVKYMPIDVSYSRLIGLRRTWAFRYAPEITALAMIDEPLPGATDPQLKRKRTYGSGVSPEGFRVNFWPEHKFQPYLNHAGGFIYFWDRVLSPQGSRWMYTVDFGGGIQFYRKLHQSVSVGYRYQHLSNANISLHNPGTDANTFYVAVSRFR